MQEERTVVMGERGVRPKKHPFWKAIWEFEYRKKDGSIERWEQENALGDEGEGSVLDSYFRAQNVPATFYLRLFNDTPTETDTLADLTGEPSTNSYAAQEITRDTTGFPTLALDSGDYMVTSKQVSFSATGAGWGPVTYMVLATTSDNAGKLIAYVALSQSRTLAGGESLGCKIKIKLQ